MKLFFDKSSYLIKWMLFIGAMSASLNSVLANDTYMETVNKLARGSMENLEKNLAAKIKESDPKRQTKFKFFSSIYNAMKGVKGYSDKNPQDDLNELATYYQALNYADLATLEFLRKNCTSDGLFKPNSDPNLCNAYSDALIKVIEARISALTSRYIFSDEILQPPSGWTGHSREILKALEAYPDNGDSQSYVVENALIKIVHDKSRGLLREDPVPKPKASPMNILTSSPTELYGPGQPVMVPVNIVPVNTPTEYGQYQQQPPYQYSFPQQQQVQPPPYQLQQSQQINPEGQYIQQTNQSNQAHQQFIPPANQQFAPTGYEQNQMSNSVPAQGQVVSATAVGAVGQQTSFPQMQNQNPGHPDINGNTSHSGNVNYHANLNAPTLSNAQMMTNLGIHLPQNGTPMIMPSGTSYMMPSVVSGSINCGQPIMAIPMMPIGNFPCNDQQHIFNTLNPKGTLGNLTQDHNAIHHQNHPNHQQHQNLNHQHPPNHQHQDLNHQHPNHQHSQNINHQHHNQHQNSNYQNQHQHQHPNHNNPSQIQHPKTTTTTSTQPKRNLFRKLFYHNLNPNMMLA